MTKVLKQPTNYNTKIYIGKYLNSSRHFKSVIDMRKRTFLEFPDLFSETIIKIIIIIKN